MKTTEWIIPATDLQADPVAVLQKAQQRPLIVTNEGLPKVYILSVYTFDALMARLSELEEAELAGSIAAGEQQFQNGEFVSLQDAVAIVEANWS